MTMTVIFVVSLYQNQRSAWKSYCSIMKIIIGYDVIVNESTQTALLSWIDVDVIVCKIIVNHAMSAFGNFRNKYMSKKFVHKTKDHLI